VTSFDLADKALGTGQYPQNQSPMRFKKFPCMLPIFAKTYLHFAKNIHTLPTKVLAKNGLSSLVEWREPT
jgi:hypothetical protein